MRGLILLTFLLFTLFKSQYSSTWHNTDNDLPQSSIKDIIKDKYGFIWLGTDHGLVKYDGLNFTVFDEFPVSNLLFDSFLGNIENDSIIVYNNYEKEKILIRGRIPKVYTAKNNNNYKLLSKRNGVYLKRIVKNDLVNSYQSNTQYFIKLKSGSYTFGKNSIIYTQRNKSVTISIPFANNYLDNIFVKDDILYITDPKKNKVYAITKGRLNILRGPDLLKDPDTRIYWHQTTGQTLFINKMNIYILVKEHGENKIRFLANYRELLNYPINALYYDENFNKLFIGTTNNGLNILDLDQFYITRDNTPFANNIFHATVPFNKNTIITGNGLEFNKSGIKKKYPFGKHGKDFMFYDSKKNIVFPDKAYIIRIKRKYHYQKADSLYINPDLDKVFASNGLYSYSTTDFIKNNFLYIFKNDEFKRPDYIYRFEGVVNSFMRYGQDILVGCTNGLYQITLERNKQKIFPGIYVKNIIKTADGNIWITTNKSGFFLFKGNKLIKMPNDGKNFLKSAHYILEDKYGYLWISSGNGLFKVQKRQLLQYADNKNTPVTYYRFSKSDGFLTNEFNNSPGHILDNGDFVFPSKNGFVFFNPDTVKTYYPSKQNIYIEKAKIDDSQTVYFKNALTLKNNYKLAVIFAELPYYANQDNLYIEAKLNAPQYSGWEKLKNNSYVIKGLSPGEYDLQFRVLVSPKGEFLYQTLKITIESRFYQTRLFKVLAIILCLVMIIWVIKIRTNFLRFRNQSLEKIVSEKENILKKTLEDLEAIREILKNETEHQKTIIETISHDIATPIKYLSNLSKNLYELEDTQSQKKYLDSIYRSSREVYKFTLNLKEYSALYREDKIHEESQYLIFELIETKKDLFQELALFNNTVIHNKVNRHITTNINKNIILAIIHNLLDNSIKNTKSGVITIEGDTVNETIEIRISDTGVGMSSEQIDYYKKLSEGFDSKELSLKKYGLGLHMVIHFIKKIGAQIYFSKNQPKGTIILIKIKK